MHALIEPSRQDAGQSSEDKKIENARLLEPGKPIEGEILGGVSHAYTLKLSPGQFLQARVEQRGIDLALKLFDPGGKKRVEADSFNGAHGPEPLPFVADVGGVYRLEVASLGADAPAGRYVVTVEGLRVATEEDKSLATAYLTYAQGLESLNQGTAESLSGALNNFRAALTLYRTLGDRRGEASSLTGMGTASYLLGERRKAVEHFTQALPHWRAAGDRNAEALSLNNIGSAYDLSGEKAKAIQYLNQALPLFRATGDRAQEALTLLNIGHYYYTRAEHGEALDYFERALLLQRATGDRAEATTHLNIGGVYESMGEYQRALDNINQALVLFRKFGDRRSEALALRSIGTIQRQLGRYQQSLDLYVKALDISRKAGDRSGEANVLNSVGKAYAALGDWQKSLDHFNEALKVARAAKVPQLEAFALHNVGLAADALGDKRQALESFVQALAFMRKLHDRHGEIRVLNDLGRAYVSLGDRQKALDNLTMALALSRDTRELANEGVTLSNLMFAWQDENPRLAVFYGKQAVNVLQQIRTNIQTLDKELQTSFVKSKEGTYRQLADLLISLGRLPEAQQVIRLLKQEEYFEFIRRDNSELAALSRRADLTAEEADALKRYTQIAEQISAIGAKYSSLDAKRRSLPEGQKLPDGEQSEYEQLAKQLDDANRSFTVFLRQLADEFGKSTKPVREDVEESRGLQADLEQWGAGIVSLYTVVGEDRYRIILTTPTVQVGGKYEIKASELNKKVLAFREAVQNPNTDPRPLAQELYNILIKPVEKDLAGAQAKTLIWSLDGVLRYLPVAALHDGKGYVAERYQNVVVTLASRTRLSDPVTAKWRGLGVGVSQKWEGFSELKAVPEELSAIIRDERADGTAATTERGVLPGRRLLDKDFTEQALKDELRRRYPLLHIASHFSFQPGDLSQSFLLLGDGKHLTLDAIKNSPQLSFAGVELLTLSACDTATGLASADGKEVESFGVLAQNRGAKAVLASLWPVSDESTRRLVERFYHLYSSVPGITKVEALRQAQISLLRGEEKAVNGSERNRGIVPSVGQTSGKDKYQHPFFWAPFILIGNWR